MSLKPVCIPCQRFFRCIKTGFYFTEGMPKGRDPEQGPVPPGTSHPELWEPYKVWSGDKYRCEGCGAEIVSGFGRNPIRVQHEEDFAEVAKTIGADKYQVNDC